MVTVYLAGYIPSSKEWGDTTRNIVYIICGVNFAINLFPIIIGTIGISSDSKLTQAKVKGIAALAIFFVVITVANSCALVWFCTSFGASVGPLIVNLILITLVYVVEIVLAVVLIVICFKSVGCCCESDEDVLGRPVIVKYTAEM